MRRFGYTVFEGEVAKFVSENLCVEEFLNRYERDGVSYGEKAVGLARFFRWLKIVKSLDLTPSQFLDLHLKKRSAGSIEERRWALSLALEHSRDNPDLRGCAMQYKYSAFFLPVKLFCEKPGQPQADIVSVRATNLFPFTVLSSDGKSAKKAPTQIKPPETAEVEPDENNYCDWTADGTVNLRIEDPPWDTYFTVANLDQGTERKSIPASYQPQLLRLADYDRVTLEADVENCHGSSRQLRKKMFEICLCPKPESTTLEARHRLALIEGQKENKTEKGKEK